MLCAHWKTIAVLAVMIMLCACSSGPTPTDLGDRKELNDYSKAAMHDFGQQGTAVSTMLSGAYGYAVFPEIGKGAVGIGGAYGRGQVYEQGKFVGYADVTQGTIGLQIGAQKYSELIIFQSAMSLKSFEEGDLSLAAQASAVLMTSGTGTAMKFQNGVAVFIDITGGLMAEAAIGAQRFNFEPSKGAGDVSMSPH